MNTYHIVFSHIPDGWGSVPIIERIDVEAPNKATAEANIKSQFVSVIIHHSAELELA